MSMPDRRLAPGVLERLEAATDARRWYEVSERLREGVKSDADRLALRWHVVAFDYQLVMPEGRTDGAREPALQPKVIFEGGTSYPDPVEALPAEAVDQWRAAVEVVGEPLLRARYRDLLWHRREGRAIDHARSAIEAYLEIARDGERFDGVMLVSAASRAIELALAVNADDLLEAAIEATVSGCQHEASEATPRPGILIRLLAVLDALPRTRQPRELVDLLNRAEALFADDPYLGKDIALMLSGHARDEDERVSVGMRQIVRWEKAHDRGLARLSNLRDAAQFAESQGLGDEARRLQREVERMTPADLDLKTISGEISLPSDEIERLIESLVGGDTYADALRRYASYGPPSGDPARTEAVVRQIAEDTPFLHLMPQTHLGPEGSILRVTRTLDEAVEVGIPRHEATSISLTSHILASTLDRMRDRYGDPDEAELVAALTTPQVDEPAARGFVRAIVRHHRGDFDAAAHLIVPRIERAVRSLARALGISVTTPPAGDRPGGVRPLGELLHDLRGRMPEAWRRYYTSLLTDPFGMNVRNTLLHGLADEADRSLSAVLIHAAVRLTLFEIQEAADMSQVDPTTPEAGE